MVEIISVTGTKGKTTIVRAIDSILASKVDNLLRVDTEGAWLNGRLVMTHNASKEIWGLSAANAPGRFMTLLANKSEPRLAVLECNLYCSKACGLGYSNHKVGVFTNVYSDHKGSDWKLQSREDIASAKSFIFSRIADGGYAVYNYDDDLVVSQLVKLPKTKKTTKIACSLLGKPDLNSSDSAIFLDKTGQIVYLSPKGKTLLGKISDYKMYLPAFPQSGLNVLMVLGALAGHHNGQLTETIVKLAQQYIPPDAEGRLIVFENDQDIKVIFDYAHEEESLKQIADFAKQLNPDGKVIGILRLSPTRTDELIKETAKAVKDHYDYFIVYDKVDGVSRRPNQQLNPFRQEKIGYTAEVFSRELKKAGAKNVEKIVQEKKALLRASAIAAKGDIIVYIQGNDSRVSLDLLNKSFNKLQRLTV